MKHKLLVLGTIEYVTYLENHLFIRHTKMSWSMRFAVIKTTQCKHQLKCF